MKTFFCIRSIRCRKLGRRGGFWRRLLRFLCRQYPDAVDIALLVFRIVDDHFLADQRCGLLNHVLRIPDTGASGQAARLVIDRDGWVRTDFHRSALRVFRKRPFKGMCRQHRNGEQTGHQQALYRHGTPFDGERNREIRTGQRGQGCRFGNGESRFLMRNFTMAPCFLDFAYGAGRPRFGPIVRMAV